MQREHGQSDARSLWERVVAAGDLSGRWIASERATVQLDEFASGSSLELCGHAAQGRSVLLKTRDQLPTALALLALDGIASRMVLCPPDVAAASLPDIIRRAEIDSIVCDDDLPEYAGLERIGMQAAVSAPPDPAPCGQTEWILCTSGTTGTPKLVVHTLASLADHMAGRKRSGATTPIWSTFYDIRRYGGLQIFLRAMLGGGSLVLSRADEPLSAFLGRVRSHGVTHMSGTPSHWRRVLMTTERFSPRYVRLSGEIADQPLLDRLRAAFESADIAHAFASTEAGLAFEVTDLQAGFPAAFLERRNDGVALKIRDDTLWIKSRRTASRYLGEAAADLRDADGYVDTKDTVERKDGRYYFAGRKDGIINIGGLKVYPEEVEAVINTHPAVLMCRVTARKSPIVGAVAVADVVVAGVAATRSAQTASSSQSEALKHEIIEYCWSRLPRHKVPTRISLVPALDLTASGKLGRGA